MITLSIPNMPHIILERQTEPCTARMDEPGPAASITATAIEVYTTALVFFRLKETRSTPRLVSWAFLVSGLVPNPKSRAFINLGLG